MKLTLIKKRIEEIIKEHGDLEAHVNSSHPYPVGSITIGYIDINYNELVTPQERHEHIECGEAVKDDYSDLIAFIGD